MIAHKKICFFTLLFLLANQVIAQSILHFHDVSNQGYLTSKTFNLTTYKDSLGFIWISSFDGLNRYDGIKVEQYKSIDIDSLTMSDNIIDGLFLEGPKDNYLVGGKDAINSYNFKSGNFTRIYPYSTKGKILHVLLFFDKLTNETWLTIGGIYIYKLNFQDPINPICMDTLQGRVGREMVFVPNSDTSKFKFIYGIKNGLSVRKYDNYQFSFILQ